jgi:hypothetical protein
VELPKLEQTLLYAVNPKGKAAERLVAQMRQGSQDCYVKHGVVFRRRNSSVEAVGPFYRVFKELLGGVKIIE